MLIKVEYVGRRMNTSVPLTLKKENLQQKGAG